MNEHFAIWSVIFAVGLGGLYAGLKVAWPQLTLAKYHVYAGPGLLILFWLYGTIFNWGFSGRFFENFNPWFSSSYEDYLSLFLLVAAGALVPAGLTYHVVTQYAEKARGHVVPLIALSVWYLAGQCLRYVPHGILRIHMGDQHLVFFDTPLVLTTIFIPVAYWLTWLSAREDTHARR